MPSNGCLSLQPLCPNNEFDTGTRNGIGRTKATIIFFKPEEREVGENKSATSKVHYYRLR